MIRRDLAEHSVPDFLAIDHVQLAMPPGREAVAREFFVNVLGMQEIPKPPALAKRGGCWFGSGGVQIHVGVEAEFRPAKKAHPALLVRNYDDLLRKLATAGCEYNESDEITGIRRCHIHDPFGNRIELVCAD